MAVLKGRLHWKKLRLTAVCVIVGLVLYFSFRGPRRIAIGSVRPYMNFRTVQVEGELVKPAGRLESGAVMYLVHDGTGRLAVFAPMPEDGRLYAAGSRIRAVGSLRAGIGGNKNLQASEVELLEPSGAGESSAALAAVGRRSEGDIVTVRGVISRLRKPAEGSRAPHKMILRDAGGRLDVVHWLDEPLSLAVGDSVEVTGAVQVYDGRVELKVFEAEAVRRLD